MWNVNADGALGPPAPGLWITVAIYRPAVIDFRPAVNSVDLHPATLTVPGFDEDVVKLDTQLAVLWQVGDCFLEPCILPKVVVTAYVVADAATGAQSRRQQSVAV